jgi:hypothetical protein
VTLVVVIILLDLWEYTGSYSYHPQEFRNIITRVVCHDANYVLVIFGGMANYSGDDISKFLWMIRIAAGVFP